MSVDNAILLIFVTFLSLNNASGECVASTNCKCVMPNGEGYDFSSIPPGAFNGFIESTTKNNVTFYFHPCSDASLNVPGKNTIGCISPKGVSLCMYNATNNQSISLATADKSSPITLASNSEPQILFPFNLTDGIQRTATINFLCHHVIDIPTELVLYNISKELNFKLYLLSPKACKIAMHVGGLSTGSVLVIILFIFSGIYFLGGALALKLLRGATGWEMLPNQKFWFDLPALVRDGIAFTFNCCRVVSYNEI
ncbi:uncharacterized protein LOC124181123 [Neodiprion fabricii]|uniref:uncharacterized protein LOC124181123 n=1 Tax=Neodiprion fabricii TaxID=2872261 RepID=UPI001ED97085|nr:uncharacterized protein LOC124181123 [Neodiprion fabricii]